MNLDKDDLSVREDDSWGEYYRRVTDAEFDQIAREEGYVKGAGYMESQVLAWIAEYPGKALRTLLTDECDCEDGLIWQEVPCDEHDHEPPLPANTSCTMLMQKQVRHEVCGGRGWLPKDGVDRFEHYIGHPQIQFPADWLET